MKKKHCSTNHQAGFTLLELMIGLIIIAILSVVFLWTGNSLQRTYRVRDAVQQAVGTLQYARMQAAIRNQNYRVQICAYNKNCAITDHKDLNAFQIITPTLAGVWFIEQCPTAKLDPSVCGDPGQKHELKFFDFSKSYRDIQLYEIYDTSNVQGKTKLDTIMLYFRPDGRILSCSKSKTGTSLSCKRGTYRLCLRVSPDIEKSGPNAIPRRVDVSFTGRIQVVADGNKSICK